MTTLIRNRQIVDDSWLQLEDPAGGAAPVLADGRPVIVSLAVWQAHRALLQAHRGGIGLLLAADAALESVVPDLPRFALVAVRFPRFGDGRAFSLARLLRERCGYRGELRAVGEVVQDQLAEMRRCGFDAYELRADQDAQAAMQAFHPFSEEYQGSVEQPLPLFKRREPASAAGGPAPPRPLPEA